MPRLWGYVLQEGFALDEPGDAEGEERGRLEEEGRANASKQILTMETIEEDWDREDGKDDRDSAGRVNTIALHLFWRHGVAFGAHLEEHQTKDGERRKEKPGKNVMRGSNMLLQRCCVVVRRRGTKSDAERKKARQYPCDL